MKKIIVTLLVFALPICLFASDVTTNKVLTVGKSFSYVFSASSIKLSNTDETVATATYVKGSSYIKFTVTGKKVGTCTIIATFWVDGEKETRIYNVTVVDVTSIQLVDPVYLYIGSTYTYTPTIVDSRASVTLTWFSSQPSVASVSSSGVVTAKSLGTTIITCTAPNGVSASSTLGVCPILASSITIAPSDYTFDWKLGIGETVKLNATVLPENTTNKGVTWVSSNEGVATVAQDGTVTGVSGGVCCITAMTIDGSNLDTSCWITVYQPQCATPTITQEDGMIRFSCDTEGVKFAHTITALESTEADGSVIDLSKTFRVSVYALKDGYANSEVVTKEITIRGLKGDVNEDGQVNITDAVGIVDIILNAGK